MSDEDIQRKDFWDSYYLAIEAMRSMTDDLSPRETEVAELAAEGLTNGQIGDRLGITDTTVKVHLKQVARRLGITGKGSTRVLIARHFWERGAPLRVITHSGE